MMELAGERVYEPDLEVELDLYYAYDPELEVELEVIASKLTAIAGEINLPHITLAVGTIAIDDANLDDMWFGEYDETREHIAPALAFDDQPTSPFRKLGNWLLRRAA